MTADNINKQTALLKKRQRALRMALKLFESLKDQDKVIEVSAWFAQCNNNPTDQKLDEAMNHFKTIGRQYHIPLDA